MSSGDTSFVDICTEFEAAVEEISRAIADLEELGPSGCAEVVRPVPRAVLLHCDLGINRSPTVAMAFLLQNGFSLRAAYRRVQGSRPQIDPIVPFRRALRDHEVRLHGVCTVELAERFAMHITELLDEVERGDEPEPSEGSDSESESDCSEKASSFQEALELLQSSIEALQRKVC